MPAAKSVATSFDPRIDDVIAKSADFAQPLLEHLRQLVHAAVPGVAEDIKWSRAFFTLHGENLCFMAAFKSYCAFGFWSPKMPEYLQSQGMPAVEGAGSIGQIKSVNDLPKDLAKYVKHAAELIRTGEAGSAMDGKTRKGTRPELEMPPAFSTSLGDALTAKTYWDTLPPSCRREYVEWITSARKDDTRDRRIASAITMLTEHRRFNSKYRT